MKITPTPPSPVEGEGYREGPGSKESLRLNDGEVR